MATLHKGDNDIIIIIIIIIISKVPKKDSHIFNNALSVAEFFVVLKGIEIPPCILDKKRFGKAVIINGFKQLSWCYELQSNAGCHFFWDMSFRKCFPQMLRKIKIHLE